MVKSHVRNLPRVLRKRALRLEQDPGHPLYQFSLTPAELFGIADISRVSRDDAGTLIGYQRPEVKRHVQDIVDYLNSDHVIFPNSLILALSSRTRFVQDDDDTDGVAAGTIEIRLPGPNDPKPAWIVDGQQRALALSKSTRQDSLAVPVNGFIADETDLQRDQFLRINNTRALPRGLITELLPEVTCPLPARLSTRKIPAQLCELLNRDERSPFRNLIRRSSNTAAQRSAAVIADMSIVKMIEDSLLSPSGCLFAYRNLATGESDFNGIVAVLLTYWSAVKAVFPEAWGKPPTRSRLMHGAGIRAMGRLMDRIMSSLNVRSAAAPRQVQAELLTIKPHCRWTSGEWEDLGGMAWKEVQNIPRHIQMLSNVLIRLYVSGRSVAGAEA